MSEPIVKSKELKFRGKSLDYLKTLDIREVAKYVPSRSRRTILRNFNIIEKFVRTCEEKIRRNKRIKTHMRDIVIVPKMVGMSINIHNGKTFEEVNITVDMIGHRLGEFTLTRQKVAHSAAGIGATRGSKAAKK